MKRILFITLGFIATFLGFLGIILPVLPTTPFLLLAAFLFSKSSKKIHQWLEKTRMYNAYVKPLENDGGLSLKKKIQILSTTYIIMILSALLVRKLPAIIFMIICAIFLLYYIGFHIKTIQSDASYNLSKKEFIEDIKDISKKNTL